VLYYPPIPTISPEKIDEPLNFVSPERAAFRSGFSPNSKNPFLE
jgi:hypothetical protein